MEDHIFQIVLGIINLLLVIIGYLINGKINDMHETVKNLMPKEVCSEKHLNNASEHESMRKDLEDHSERIRHVEMRPVGYKPL